MKYSSMRAPTLAGLAQSGVRVGLRVKLNNGLAAPRLNRPRCRRRKLPYRVPSAVGRTLAGGQLSSSPSNPILLFNVTDEVRHSPGPNRPLPLFQERAITTEQFDVLGCDIRADERIGRHAFRQKLQCCLTFKLGRQMSREIVIQRS